MPYADSSADGGPSTSAADGSTSDSTGSTPGGRRNQSAYPATRPRARTASSTDGYAGTRGGNCPSRNVATVGFSPASATLPSAAAKSASSSGNWPGSGGAKTTTSASTRSSTAASARASANSCAPACGLMSHG